MGKQKTPSYLDPTLTQKIEHEDAANAKRVLDIDNVVGQFWSRADVTYDGNGSATNSKFYLDTLQEITKVTVTGDVAGSLNNKYFLINSGLDNTEYYIWYNVGATGVDPAPVGKTGIEVPINFNESSGVVALATRLIVHTVAGSDFNVKNFSNCITFDNVQYGETTDATDFNSGFTVDVDRQGESTLILDYDIPQQNGIRYVYNEMEKEFEAFNTNINVQLGKAETPIIVNQLVVLSAVEVNVALPNGTKKFSIRMREGDVNMEVGYTSGGTYIKLKRGNEYIEEGLDTDNVTLYFKTDVGNRTVELVYWT